MYMGQCISIDYQTGDYDFLCSSVATGATFEARVDLDKRHLFLERTWSENHPNACPFLRPSGDRVLCTIHETSPAQCKAYRCVVLWIYGRGGDLLGTVTGTLALHTEDQELRCAWEESGFSITRFLPDIEREIKTVLTKKGFRVQEERPSRSLRGGK